MYRDSDRKHLYNDVQNSEEGGESYICDVSGLETSSVKVFSIAGDWPLVDT